MCSEWGPGNEKFSLVEIGLVYGVLGDMDQAFEFLNRAFLSLRPGTIT
jgi:hypothetical protein